MEIWYETGEITWRSNLPDEVEAELTETFQRWSEEPDTSLDNE
ncbi:hypothetical protein [Streptomyces sp. NBC_01546]